MHKALFIFSEMSEIDDYEIPALLPSRAKRERRPAANIGAYFQPDLGSLNELRDTIHATLTNIKEAPQLDLGGSLSDLRWRAENPPPKPPARQRKLPEKVGVNELFNVVQNMKRDKFIRLIKNAQSKAGAENWIIRNGYEPHLYVDDRDIDGDNIPDIVVRKRSDRSPYIVKGYTTEQSAYPQRNRYYTKYPTAAARKGHSYRDFVDHDTIESFADKGFTRVLNKDAYDTLQKSRAQGYKVSIPNKSLTNNQAFKYFIMKPLMNAYKEVAYSYDDNLTLEPTLVRNIEAYIRDNIITVPVLVRVYGAGILQMEDKKEWRKLANRKEVKDGCRVMIQRLIENRMTDDVYSALVSSMLDILEQNKGLPDPSLVTKDTLAQDIVAVLHNSPDWVQPRLQK
jgi:hypothetical protein